jgi:hypothetical protein
MHSIGYITLASLILLGPNRVPLRYVTADAVGAPTMVMDC